MRKNRFLALQKMAEQKKNEAMNASNAALNNGGPDQHGIPKQTVWKIIIFRINIEYVYYIFRNLITAYLSHYINIISDGPFQSSRSENALQGRLARKYNQSVRSCRRRSRKIWNARSSQLQEPWLWRRSTPTTSHARTYARSSWWSTSTTSPTTTTLSSSSPSLTPSTAKSRVRHERFE